MNPLFETVPQDAGSSLHLSHFTCDSLAADHTWHYHPEFELTWIVRSRGTRLVGNSVARYVANDLVLCGPGLAHCWNSDPFECEVDRPEVLVLQFGSEVIGPSLLALPEAKAVADLLAEASSGLLFPQQLAQDVGSLMLGTAPLTGLARIGQLLTILDRLAHSPRQRLTTPDSQPSTDLAAASREKVEAVHARVRANLDGHISQAKIAASLGMTPPEFSKFFRSATGQTFVTFVNTLRLNEACRLLIGTKMSITRVAMECGYNNLSHFNRQFLLHRGTTPSAFRKSRDLRETAVSILGSNAGTRFHADDRPAAAMASDQ